MELWSGTRLTSLPPPHRARRLRKSPPQHGAASPTSPLQRDQPGSGGQEDRISALPDDMLLVVLARLGCASAAARTGVLSRRWRGLWTGLTKATFRDLELGALEAALTSLGSGVRLLDICPAGEDEVASDRVSSVLHAAARLSPVELVFTLRQDILDGECRHPLPNFHRATSIELDTPYMAVPPTGGFPALDRLSISRCYGVDFATLILGCPRLRVLRARCFGNVPNIKIHSASLEELVLDKFVVQQDDGAENHIDIIAPVLKQLVLSFTARTLQYSVSISAPMVEKLSWHCWYSPRHFKVGAFWFVMRLWLTTAQRPSATLRALANNSEGTCLSMEIYVHCTAMDAHGNFAEEIQKLPVVDFTVLALYLKFTDQRHVFVPMVLHLLATKQIRTNTRKLKVVLERWSNEKRACPTDCPCDHPKNWGTKTISLTTLQEVEIQGFEGLDDDLDFLILIFQCAPMLKRLTLKLLGSALPSKDAWKKIHNMFKKYPSVELYLTSVPV